MQYAAGNMYTHFHFSLQPMPHQLGGLLPFHNAFNQLNLIPLLDLNQWNFDDEFAVESWSDPFNGNHLLVDTLVCVSPDTELLEYLVNEEVLDSLPNWAKPLADLYEFRPLDSSIERERFLLKGKTLFVTCWRQNLQYSNPAHIMVGYGRLFSYLFSDVGHSEAFDNVILFQCPHPKANKWLAEIETLFEQAMDGFTERKAFTKDTNFIVSPLYDSYQSNMSLCSEKIVFNEHLRTPFGTNHELVVSQWKSLVSNYLGQKSNIVSSTPSKFNCINPGIKVYYRSQGTSLRKFVNFNNIIRLLNKFSNKVSIFTSHSTTSFIDQVSAFRDFDILVTPHGAHLTNAIFATRDDIYIIEITLHKLFFEYEKFLHGFGNFTSSTGHGFVQRPGGTFNKIDDPTKLNPVRERNYRINARNVYLNVDLEILNLDIKRILDYECNGELSIV